MRGSGGAGGGGRSQTKPAPHGPSAVRSRHHSSGGVRRKARNPEARKRQHLWLGKECNRLSARVRFIMIGPCAASAVALAVSTSRLDAAVVAKGR